MVQRLARVFPTLMVDGRPYRPSEGIALRRVRCGRRECRRSWTLRPPWLYPHRSLTPDVAEAAALAYLREPNTSYATVAATFGCAWITVWRWIGWLAALATPAALLARAARLAGPGGVEPGLLPREVPAGARARSTGRARTVLEAAQILGALAILHRAQPEPPADPSPLQPGVRLPDGLDRLAATVAQVAPRLLVLDPLIRLHRADENSAAEMAVILDGLRALARATECAVLLVHHTRKAPAGGIAGHGLRGTSDLHAFGDTNLYLRRTGPDPALELRIEHRAAACPPPLRLRLDTEETAVGPIARFVCDDALPTDPLRERALTLFRRATAPVTTDALRTTLGVRKQTLLAVLQRLAADGLLRRAGREGRALCVRPVPVPDSICGNGNARID